MCPSRTGARRQSMRRSRGTEPPVPERFVIDAANLHCRSDEDAVVTLADPASDSCSSPTLGQGDWYGICSSSLLLQNRMKLAFSNPSETAVRAIDSRPVTLENELAIFTLLKPARNVTQLYGLCLNAWDGRMRLVLELCDHGNVRDYVKSLPRDQVSAGHCGLLTTVYAAR